jgi:SRSO17 transposase
LTDFVQRYLPLFYRAEQRANAALVIRGLLSGLQRKSCEPMAGRVKVPRKPVQCFVGAGKWDDEAVMAEVRVHVREELAEPEGVVVIDGSTFLKKGTESCGVQRQWCGRLGKTENCQAGVYVAYAGANGYAPLDRRLYLPKEWAADRKRRRKCHVPKKVVFQAKWQIALDLLERSLPELAHGWIVGDDEFGRPAEFRAALRARGERYILDVPCDTNVHELKRGRRQVGQGRDVPFVRVDSWVAQQPQSNWCRLHGRDGEKGPLMVDAMSTRVCAKLARGNGPEEWLLVTRVVGESKIDYSLSNAGPKVSLHELARVHSQRHRIEEMFEAAKGEVGLAHYEVRSWVGWHHHMTLSMLALWFLCLERRRVGKKNPGHHRSSDAHPVHEPTAKPAANRGRNRRRDHEHAVA